MGVKRLSSGLILILVVAFMLFSNQAFGGERKFIGDTYVVTIPAVVELEENEDGTFSGQYEVVIEGLDDGYEIISVVPEDHLLLETVGKKGITAYVEQPETEFDFSTTQTLSGRVYTTQYIGAGDWTGSLGFKIRAVPAQILDEDAEVASPSDAEMASPSDASAKEEEQGAVDTEEKETFDTENTGETKPPDINMASPSEATKEE